MAAPGSHRGGSGEPLVLIHGFTGTWRLWKRLLPRLEARHDVLAVGIAGHFECASLPAGAEPSISSLADAIERDMDAAGFQTAHLAGNSLGGWLALELAKRARARSVVALSPAGGWEPGSDEELRILDLFARAHRRMSRLGPRAERLARRRLGRWLLFRLEAARPSRIDAEEAVYDTRAFLNCPIFFQLLDAARRDGPLHDVEGVDCPVRIAWAERDRVLPLDGYSRRFRELLPAAEFQVLPGVGHVPMWDDPDLVARTILEVTARSDSAQPARAGA